MNIIHTMYNLLGNKYAYLYLKKTYIPPKNDSNSDVFLHLYN